MKKLEFMNLSLQYGLKIMLTSDNDDWFESDEYNEDDEPKFLKGAIWKLIGINDTKDLFVPFLDGSLEEIYSNDDVYCAGLFGKPILHPLSDLQKDEWITKIDTFACEVLDAAHVYDEDNVIGINWSLQPFAIVQKLIEWHFNLMDESEPFIDVNTLDINPYK